MGPDMKTGRKRSKRIRCPYCSRVMVGGSMKPHKQSPRVPCPEGWNPWEDPYPARYEGLVDIGGDRWYVRWLGPEIGEYMARCRGLEGWLSLSATAPYLTVPTHPAAYANALRAALGRADGRGDGSGGSTDPWASDKTGSMTWRGPAG